MVKTGMRGDAMRVRLNERLAAASARERTAVGR